MATLTYLNKNSVALTYNSKKIYYGDFLLMESGDYLLLEPGLPSVLHPIIPYKIALEVAGINNLPQINFINKKVEEWEKIFIDYFTNRGSENKVSLKPVYYNFE